MVTVLQRCCDILFIAISLCAAVTCGGAAVLRILCEGHGSLHSVFLHLFDGVLRQRLNIPETNVELVRS